MNERSERARQRPLDELDLALIQRLRDDGRASNRSVAQALGVNEATVASRLRRLEDEHLVRVVAVTDMRALGHEFLAFGKIRVRDRDVFEVGAALAELPENIAVVTTLGHFDLVVSTLARDRDHLLDLVSERVPSVPGVDTVRWEVALDICSYRFEWAILGVDDLPEEPRAHTTAVDDLDLRIVEALQRDARTSNRSIAATLGVSEGTVRARIRRMEDEKVIRIQALTDVRAIGLESSAYVAVDVDGGRSADVAKRLVDLDGITSVVRSLGDHDLWCVVAVETRAALVDLVLEVAAMPGVRRTETADVVRVLKHAYTWARIV